MDSVTIAQIKSEVSRLLQAQEYNLAYAALDSACDDTQTDVELWFTLARVCHARSDMPGLVRSCRRVIALCPDHVGSLFNLGVALLQEKDKHVEAKSYFQKVLELEPDHAGAHDCLGQLLEVWGNLAEAKQHYLLATESQHAKPDHFQHLGMLQMKTRHFELAEMSLLTALSMGSSDPDTYMGLGRVQCELGKLVEATSAFETALSIDPDLKEAEFWLSAINDTGETDAAKHRSVSKVFDGYAEDFNDVLVNRLKYRIPWLIGDLVREFAGSSEKLDILDLGCGTGLCADTLGEIADRVVGVDLSQKMLDIASRKGSYTELVHGEIVEVMLRNEHSYDLVVAADVFIYVGGLDEVFSACLKVLKAGGMFVFSVENNDEEGCKLQATGRYAHSNDYIEHLARQFGYRQLARNDVKLRMEVGKVLPGTLYLYRKQSGQQYPLI